MRLRICEHRLGCSVEREERKVAHQALLNSNTDANQDMITVYTTSMLEICLTISKGNIWHVKVRLEALEPSSSCTPRGSQIPGFQSLDNWLSSVSGTAVTPQMRLR